MGPAHCITFYCSFNKNELDLLKKIKLIAENEILDLNYKKTKNL